MIQNRKEYRYYLDADRLAKAISVKQGIGLRIRELFFPNYIWKFQKLMRRSEYYKNCRKGPLGKIMFFILFYRYKKLSYKLGFSIPLNTFGPGLSIAHHGTIVVNSAARIGSNCRIHVGVNIGSEAGYGSNAPVIGNNCYIGPGAKIFGSIRIADHVAVGANAVVNKDIEEKNIAVGGIPAKKIADTDTYTIIIPGTEIIDRGLQKEAEEIIRRAGNDMTEKIYALLMKDHGL